MCWHLRHRSVGSPPALPYQRRAGRRGKEKMLNRDVKLPIPCPQCKQEIQESIGRLETNPTLVCPACGFSFRVEGEHMKRGLAEVERLLAEFRRKIGGIKL